MVSQRLVGLVCAAIALAALPDAARGEADRAQNPCAASDEPADARAERAPEAQAAVGEPAEGPTATAPQPGRDHGTRSDAADDEEEHAFGTTGACIDAVIADRLAAERRRRGATPRLYVKQARHELSAGGGYYVSDLYAGTYLANAAYTYHMTETTALEITGGLTYADASLLSAAQDGRADVVGGERERVVFGESLLVWSPVYGKFRLGGEVMRFDINLGAGFGVIDAPTARGLTGVAGAGVKLFLSEAFALRFDARDHIHRQQLLESSFWVNDVSLTLGLSTFLPFRN